jgi:triphosphoribosyl-dephospho-CoA synthetase
MPVMTMDDRTSDYTHGDRLFGEIAVRLFMASRKDVDRAVKAQFEARGVGALPNLGEVMIGLEILSENQVKAILKAQEHYDERTVETLYGNLAVKNNFVTKADLEAALRIQERTGRRLRIGEVLVKKGFVTWEQHEALLRAQERILMGIKQRKQGEPHE